MHSQLDAFSNVLHLVHVIHSCALPYVCILNVMHFCAFLCMQMRCILMHSNYDAFMCINSYSSSRRRMNDLEHAPRTADSLIHAAWCVRIHNNTLKCVRMRTNAHNCAGLVVHTYTRDAKRTQGQTHMDGHTWMHMNASECARMHLTVGSHILTQEKPSGLKAKHVDRYGLDGLPEGVPM